MAKNKTTKDPAKKKKRSLADALLNVDPNLDTSATPSAAINYMSSIVDSVSNAINPTSANNSSTSSNHLGISQIHTLPFNLYYHTARMNSCSSRWSSRCDHHHHTILCPWILQQLHSNPSTSPDSTSTTATRSIGSQRLILLSWQEACTPITQCGKYQIEAFSIKQVWMNFSASLISIPEHFQGHG